MVKLLMRIFDPAAYTYTIVYSVTNGHDLFYFSMNLLMSIT